MVSLVCQGLGNASRLGWILLWKSLIVLVISSDLHWIVFLSLQKLYYGNYELLILLIRAHSWNIKFLLANVMSAKLSSDTFHMGCLWWFCRPDRQGKLMIYKMFIGTSGPSLLYKLNVPSRSPCSAGIRCTSTSKSSLSLELHNNIDLIEAISNPCIFIKFNLIKYLWGLIPTLKIGW